MSFLLSFSALLFLSFCSGNALIGDIPTASHYHTRVTLRNAGDKSVSLVDYTLTVYTRGSGNRIHALEPISGAVIQPTATYSVCHPKHPDPCDAYWSGVKFGDDDIIELSNGDVVIDGVIVGNGKTEVGRISLEASSPKHSGLVLEQVLPVEGHDQRTQTGEDWVVYDTDTGAFNQEEDIFDDKCWSIRSKLSRFSLDSCKTPISKESITVGAFNTLFLFDGIRDRRSEWQTATEADEHLHRIADVVRQNQPDILHLEEVENLEMVERLIAEVGKPKYVPYFVKGRDYYTGQDVALMTQGEWVRSLTRTNCRSSEVAGSHCGASLSTTIGVSKNLVALFDSCLFGFKFAIVGVHFYAFPTTKLPCIRRESQARVIQDVVTQLIEAGFEVMVMGDLNDYSDRYEDVFTRAGPTSRVLAMMRDPNEDGVEELDNVMKLLPKSERYTAWWDRDGDDDYPGIEEATMIDHILMTKKLFARIQSVWIDHSMDPEIVSDHWPMFVRMATGNSKI